MIYHDLVVKENSKFPDITILSAQPNTYKKIQSMIIVQYIKEFNVGNDGNVVWQIMVVLKFKKIDLDPDGNI